MVTETLAVVGGEDDERARQQATFFERLPKVSDQRIGVGDLAVVGSTRVL